MKNYGRLTLPTDLDVIDQTIALKERLGADAIRDCDGTQMPKELLDLESQGKIQDLEYHKVFKLLDSMQFIQFIKFFFPNEDLTSYNYVNWFIKFFRNFVYSF